MVRVEERRDEHTHTFILLNLVARTSSNGWFSFVSLHSTTHSYCSLCFVLPPLACVHPYRLTLSPHSFSPLTLVLNKRVKWWKTNKVRREERNEQEEWEQLGSVDRRLREIVGTKRLRFTVPFQTLTLGLTVPKITSSNQSNSRCQSIHKNQSSAGVSQFIRTSQRSQSLDGSYCPVVTQGPVNGLVIPVNGLVSSS